MSAGNYCKTCRHWENQHADGKCSFEWNGQKCQCDDFVLVNDGLPEGWSATKGFKNLLSAVILTLLLSFSAFAQCRDLPTMQFFDRLRQFPPITVQDFTGEKIFFTITTKEQVFISEMEIDDKTRLPLNFEKIYKQGKFILYYCEGRDQNTVLLIVKDEPSSVKTETKKQMDARLAKQRKQ
jgi:hypothetical protein